MGAESDIPGVEMWGKGRGSYTLPCGYVDPSGIVHKNIVLKEMTGFEDSQLDDGEVAASERISNVLSSCIEKLGTVTDKAIITAAVSDTLTSGLPLTSQDRIAAMLFLRRVTLGDIYNFERKCPKCGDISKGKFLDLSKIDITPVKDPTKRKVQVKLPHSGKLAILKVLSASGESKVANLKINQKKLKSYAILARLDSLDGRPMKDTDEDVDIIEALPFADRSYLIQVYQLIENNIDTDVEVKCRECKFEYEFPLDLGGLYFLGQAKKPSMEELTWL